MIMTGRRRAAVTGADGLLLGLLCLKASRAGFCSDQDIRACALGEADPAAVRTTGIDCPRRLASYLLCSSGSTAPARSGPGTVAAGLGVKDGLTRNALAFASRHRWGAKWGAIIGRHEPC